VAYMEWSEKLSVGVESVDAQHKRLVAMVNDLFDAMKEGHGKDTLATTLDELVFYTVYHFSYEEKLFAQTEYPEAAAHKKEHEDLTQQVIVIQNKFKSGASFALSMEVMEFLKDWLVHHIMGSDKKFGPHMVANGIK
jgi:hemerythrin